MRFLSYLLGYLLSETWTTIWEDHHAGETTFWSTEPAKPSSVVKPAMVPDMWVKLSWSLQASHSPGEYHWVTSFGNRGGAGTKPLALDHKHETLSAAVRGPAPPNNQLSVVCAAESAVRGRWRPSPWGPPGRRVSWGPRDRLKAVSHRAPEPSPLVTHWPGPDLEAAVNFSPIPASVT